MNGGYNLDRRLKRLEEDVSEHLTFVDFPRLIGITDRVKNGAMTEAEGDAASLQISKGKALSPGLAALFDSLPGFRTPAHG